MKTIFFSTGTFAISKAINKLGLTEEDNILLPDYYCEEITLFLSNRYKINSYEINNNLKPKLDIVKMAIRQNAKLIILVQYFNCKLDLNEIIEHCKKERIKVLVDAIHIFPSNGKRLYKKANAEVYSIRKSLHLNNGSIAYVNNKLLKNTIDFNSFNIKNNLISLIKILRAFWMILYLPIFSNIYREKKLLKNNNHKNEIITADITSIIFCGIIRNFNIIYLINKLTKKRFNKIINTESDYFLTFGYQSNKLISKKSKHNIYKWPTPVYTKRIKNWTINCENLYNKNDLLSRYFYRK
tara:strand:+ start:35625 stop:36515 length:891 start_codon:yes stop_codon:yes gene_type:complete